MWYSICNMTKFVYEIESQRGSESNEMKRMLEYVVAESFHQAYEYAKSQYPPEDESAVLIKLTQVVPVLKVLESLPVKKHVDDKPNILGFTSVIDPDGNRSYGCRGQGEDYDHFYMVFLKNRSYVSMPGSFPWDYFVFTDEHDEHDFLAKYSYRIDYQ